MAQNISLTTSSLKKITVRPLVVFLLKQKVQVYPAEPRRVHYMPCGIWRKL